MKTPKDKNPKKNARGKCATRFCRNLKPERRTLCHKCRKRWARVNDPEKYAFENLKRSADIRGIAFSLELEWFRDFCKKTEYAEKRGRGPWDLTVDRIDASQGYMPGNVRVIPMCENVARSNRERAAMAKFFPEYKETGCEDNHATYAESEYEPDENPF